MPIFHKILLTFSAIYLLFLTLSISFLDANTPLDNRILSPLYFAALGLIFFALGKVWAQLSAKSLGRAGLWVAVGIFLLISGAEGMAWVQYGRQHGLGFTGRSWQESPLRAEIVEVPSEQVLFSNSPEAVYFLTERPAHPLPRKVEATTRRPNANYQAELLAIEKVHGSRLVVILFADINQRNAPSAQDLVQLLGMTAVAETTDGTIFVFR